MNSPTANPHDDRFESVATDLYHDLRKHLPQALQLLSAVPDEKMDAFLIAIARNQVIGGPGRKARKLAVEAAGGDVLRALSPGWDEAIEGESEVVDEELLALVPTNEMYALATIASELNALAQTATWLRTNEGGATRISNLPVRGDASEDGQEK